MSEINYSRPFSKSSTASTTPSASAAPKKSNDHQQKDHQQKNHQQKAGKPQKTFYPAKAPKPYKPKVLNLRARVILLLQDVTNGQSLNQILGSALANTNPRDKALFNELVMGTLRHWFALDAQIQPMLSKPLTDDRVRIALLVGLYQLLQTRIPAHAAISETVEAIRQLGLDKASGLVNALLRRATREFDALTEQFAQHHALPRWLYARMQQDWPDQAEHIALSLREAAPLTLRVNTRQRSREVYLQALVQSEIQAEACVTAPDAIHLLQSVQVPELVGYVEGWFSVQDEHAQLCAELLGDVNDKRVLDACAAPGGKTAHILEKNTPALLVALDSDEKRLQRVHENLERLQLKSGKLQVITADASTWQPDEQFDAILLDAPCTATGVIRRHPDIRLLRQPTDVSQTVALQAKLLDHLWQQLKVNGVLLYVTCSILKVENEQQIAAFLNRTQDAMIQPLQIENSVDCVAGNQLFPQKNGGDGFYFAKIKKI